MDQSYSNKWQLLLIAVSLIMLGIFLSLWLKKIYTEELATFQKESSYLFSNAINEWESDFFQKVIQGQLEGLPDTAYFLNGQVKIKGHVDTVINAFTVPGVDHQHHVDTSFKIMINAERKKGKKIGKRALYGIMTQDSSSLATGGEWVEGQDSMMIAFVQDKFELALMSSDLPKEFRIIRMENSDSFPQSILVSESFRDISSGESYAVSFDEIRPTIYKRMLPEFLFSLLLFACISTAFLVIYKNLMAQKRLNALKNDFVSNITHELKTPITTVSVAMEALSNFQVLEDPEKTKEYLDISKQELNRLSILVDKVLKMSLFEQKEPELKIEDIDLQALIAQITNSMSLQLEKNKAKLNFRTEGSDFQIKGDRIHLSNVIYNLLDNALKYSRKNPEIDIGLGSDNNDLKIKVRDKGIGIPAQYLDKVFDKFFRVPTGDTHNVKGYGLGLNYVASVIRKHGGSISVESAQGHGTTFNIKLPKQHV